MKILIPFVTLFLASCGVHHHRYDADQDAYYQEDYYAYDNYDPYYGYGGGDYSYAGDGVYYNNYNYYPDRWGVNYSNVYYSPFRYPRVGFYYSSANSCGYSYWSTWCYPGYWPSYYYTSAWWPSFGFGLSYSSYYHDNYWWYNHWRNRNNYYDNYHYRPTQRGYYSARNEALRLNSNRNYSRYKGDRPVNNSRYYNKPQPVSRSRSSSTRNRSVNRTPARVSKPARSNNSSYRGRQEAQVNDYSSRTSQTASRGSTSRNEVVRRSAQADTQNDLRERIRQERENNQVLYQQSRYQQPATDYRRRQLEQPKAPDNTVNRVKPMTSQSPVYHTNRIAKPNQNVQTNRSVDYSNRTRQNANQSVIQRQATPASRPQASNSVTQYKPAKPNRSRASEKKSKSRGSSDRVSSKDRSRDRN